MTISWTPPVVNSYSGGTPTGYRIYASVNGYGFDGGTLVAGGAITTATLAGYDPTLPYYFKVVAVNAGGESEDSEVVAVLPSGGDKRVLIVNGFDRNDRALNPRQTLPAPDNTVDRVRPRGSNTRDYVVQVETAIQAAAPGTHVNSTSNESVISGAVNLADYSTVIWILGEESTADRTFDATEQTKVEQYIAGGGNLFVTGAEIGWDLDNLNNGRTFYEGTLKGNYVADAANTYSVNGSTNTIFSGLTFSFDNGALFYNSEYADVISPQSGAQTVLSYANGAGGAGIQVARNRRARQRGDVRLSIRNDHDSGKSRGGDGSRARFLLSQRGFQRQRNRRRRRFRRLAKQQRRRCPRMTQGDANGDGLVNQTDYAIWRSQFGSPPPLPIASAASGTELAEVELAALSRSVSPTSAIVASTTVENRPSSSELNLFALASANDSTIGLSQHLGGHVVSPRISADTLDWAQLLNVIAEQKAVAPFAGASESSSLLKSDDDWR